MLGISWSELLVVLLVALMLIDPKDLPAIISAMRKMMNKFAGIKKEFSNVVDEIVYDADLRNSLPKTKYIRDMEGNLREVYDLETISEIKNSEIKAPDVKD